jgi:acyl CoA:acetate/3-ketoacid CoA transferase alpha subunit
VEVRRDGTVDNGSPAKEVRSFGDRDFVLEDAIICDFGLVRAWKGDRHPGAGAGRRQAHRERTVR